MPLVRPTYDDETTTLPRRQFFTKAAALSAALAAPVTAYANAPATSRIRTSISPTAYDIDASMDSPNQESRVRTLVLHYTAVDLEGSLKILTNPERNPAVSAHYVVPDTSGDNDRFTVHQLVDESRLAHHAGVSFWLGERMLNATSIGIEIVNLGFPAADNRVPLMERAWHEYPSAQIAVVAPLVSEIAQRHRIAPNRIVGHADIAPGRKTDPGPKFPWEALHKAYGIGAWPDDDTVSWYGRWTPYAGDIRALQAGLLTYGYDTPQTGELDQATRNVIESFQMHFCASHRYDGMPDVQTVAVLDALLEKYLDKPRPAIDTLREGP